MLRPQSTITCNGIRYDAGCILELMLNTNLIYVVPLSRYHHIQDWFFAGSKLLLISILAYRVDTLMLTLCCVRTGRNYWYACEVVDMTQHFHKLT